MACKALVCVGLLCLAVTTVQAGWHDVYHIDNSGNVKAKQTQYQASGNFAYKNSGDVNQQSSNQGIQQAGNGNSADNYNKQKISGRRLQGDYYHIDNSGNVKAKQSQYQASGNFAYKNSGSVNQQSSNQAIQQAGNGNSAENYNKQKISGRRLLGDKYHIDNSGNVWAKQGQAQFSGNFAAYNKGSVNQQSSNQAIQQAGNGNSATNYNKQKISGRKLLGDKYHIDNSGNVWAKQGQVQFSGNFAAYNKGSVNQQSSNQAIQQAGNGNYASNYNKQKIEGRRLLGEDWPWGGDYYYIDNSGNVWAKQYQYQDSENVAIGNGGDVNQQSSNQAIQQAGNGNSASNSNEQTIGRRLLGEDWPWGGDYYWIDNSGNVWAKQYQYQDSENVAIGNGGNVNQQSSNQAIQQAGNGNSASNSNEQTIKP